MNAQFPQQPVMAGTPFMIHALGRSRTAWLSAFLSYAGWKCHHEVALGMRTMDDFRNYLARQWTGTAETGAILAWPLIHHYRPDMRTVVIKRDVKDATAAMINTYTKAGLQCDTKKMDTIFRRADAALDRISAHPSTLTVSYDDLSTEEGCRRVFEFCLGLEMDRARWRVFRDQHIEADLRAVVSYYWANREGVENFKRLCKKELIRLVRSGELSHAVR